MLMDRPPIPPNFITPSITTKPVQVFRDNTDAPQYVCTEESCGKRFGRKEHLARHMRAHANDKPYKCPEEGCDADFTRSDLLKRHIETKHPPPTPPGSSPKRHLSGDGSNRYKRPRTTNACRGCADSKVKCDGETPVCGRCRRRERQCVWSRPKDPSPKMRVHRVGSDSSSASLVEQRRASVDMMLTDPPSAPVSQEGRRTPINDGRPHPTAALDAFIAGREPRPQLSHSLSFDSATGVSALAPPQFKPPQFGLPGSNVGSYPKPLAPTEPPINPHMETSETIPSQAIHSQGESTISGDTHGHLGSLAPPPPQYITSATTGGFPPHPQYPPPQFGYDSNFYVPPSHANLFHFDSGQMPWSVDPFDVSGHHLTNAFDDIPLQWAENLENVVAEGLDVNRERDPSTPSVDDEIEPSQSNYMEKGGPTSHPNFSSPMTPAKITDEVKDEHPHKGYVGYEHWDQKDTRQPIETVDFVRAATILLQEHARRIRATAQPSRYGHLMSSIKLTEERRDDIKSMLDDTFAHSRLNSPSDKDPPRLPRLEIFNILLKSYFHNFHPQHPILHVPSLVPQLGGNSALDRKKDILIYAMCCAGAFRHSARPIQEYARGMQELLRRTFIYHFEKDGGNLRNLQSLQGLHLSIYVGAWSGSAWASESSQALCGLLDTALRCSGWFDGNRGDWFEEELRPVAAGEEEDRWKAFVAREESKRLIIAQFSLECHLGSFTRARPSIMWSELTMPLECDIELWAAETATEWAKLWNQTLGTKLPRGDEEISAMGLGLSSVSATCMLRHLAKLSSNTSTAPEFARYRDFVRHLPVLLMGIHSLIASVSDNRSCFDWESKAITATTLELKGMLDYWWAAREACPTSTTDWLEFFIVDVPPNERSIYDIHALWYHFTAMMLHIPLRDVRSMNERNYGTIRKAATARLWNTWKENNGEAARTGLYHAGQIIRLARIMISNDSGPLWLAPMVAESANVMWAYANLIYHDSHIQQQNIFNGEHFRLDSEKKLESIPLSNRQRGVPSIINRKGEILTLFDPRGVVSECAEILNRGPLKKTKHAKGRTILDELFITELDKLMKFGNVKVSFGGIKSCGIVTREGLGIC